MSDPGKMYRETFYEIYLLQRRLLYPKLKPYVRAAGSISTDPPAYLVQNLTIRAPRLIVQSPYVRPCDFHSQLETESPHSVD